MCDNYFVLVYVLFQYLRKFIKKISLLKYFSYYKQKGLPITIIHYHDTNLYYY